MLRRTAPAPRTLHPAPDCSHAATPTYLGRPLTTTPHVPLATGVEEVECDLDAQKVTVTGAELPPVEDMLAALKKWGDAAGKTVELAQ